MLSDGIELISGVPCTCVESHNVAIGATQRRVDLDPVGTNLCSEPKNMGFNVAVPGPDARVHIGL